jgi:hypothetical protein
MKKIATTFLTHYAAILITAIGMGPLPLYYRSMVVVVLVYVLLAFGVGCAMHLGVSYFANRSWKATAKRNQELAKEKEERI